MLHHAVFDGPASSVLRYGSIEKQLEQSVFCGSEDNMGRFLKEIRTRRYISKDTTPAGDIVWGTGYVPPTNIALRVALEALSEVRGKILEVGCGAGRFIRTIKRLRPDFVASGCDKSREAIDHARRHNTDIDFALGDAEDLPYPSATFDAVVFFDLLEHLTNPQEAMGDVHRVLKAGGTFHGLVPCEGQPGTLHWLMWRVGVVADLKERHAGHIQRFTHSGIRRLFDQEGLHIKNVLYSMHLIGQMRDILSYMAEESWAVDLPLMRRILQLVVQLLWPFSRLEFLVFRRIPAFAVNMHVTAVRPA